MRNRISLLWAGLGALALSAGTSVAADTHVILATDDFQWSYNGQQSKLITVGDLKVGDILDIQVPETLKHAHGFVTIITTPSPITETELPVLKCGEDASKKPNAVLKEECAPGAASQFGINKSFKGSMKLIVTDKFTKDVPFWCAIHKSIMRGVLKLQTATPR